MRPPRISMALLLGAVALAALDFALVRRAHSGANWLTEGDLILGLILPGNALIVAVFRIVQQVRQQRVCSPFLVGFAAFVGAGMLLFPLVGLVFPRQVEWYVDFFVDRFFNLLEHLGLAHSSDQFNDMLWLYVIEPALAAIVYSTPQLVLAFAGGRLTQRLGIVVVRREPLGHREMV